MNKLYKLKKWFTLEDACKRLSDIFEEKVSIKDLIQLVIEEQINVSWYFQFHQGINAVEVINEYIYVLEPTRGKEFLSTNAPLKYITQAQALVPQGEFFRVYVGADDSEIEYAESGIHTDYKAISEVINLDGAYNIDINTGHIRQTLESIFFETVQGDEHSYYFTGIIVKDINGVSYKLIDNDNIDEYEKYINDIPYWSQPPYPLKQKPKVTDLVILRSDLEQFEQSFLEEEPKTCLRTPVDSLALALGLMSEILSKKTTQFSNGTKPNFKQLAKSIEQEAALLGIDLIKITNLQKDLSTSHKIIQDLTK
jgi:hypothetical protein